MQGKVGPRRGVRPCWCSKRAGISPKRMLPPIPALASPPEHVRVGIRASILIQTIAGLVASGVGIALLPAFVGQVQRNGVTIVPLKEKPSRFGWD